MKVQDPRGCKPLNLSGCRNGKTRSAKGGEVQMTDGYGWREQGRRDEIGC